MGVIWTVWPLDGDMTDWLSSQDIDFPAVASRFPTGAEIKLVLSDPLFQVEINDNGLNRTWQALIEHHSGPDNGWANLIISEYSGDIEPQKLYFEKGDETLIRLLLMRLAGHCGPLVLIDDAGDPPRVITAE